MSTRYANIEQLDELRKSGALSEDEYEVEKNHILNAKDEPQRTIIQTRERSSFGSIVFGGIALFAIVAGLYFLIMQNSSGDSAAEADSPAGLDLSSPVEDRGAVFEEEVTVTSGNDDGGSGE